MLKRQRILVFYLSASPKETSIHNVRFVMWLCQVMTEPEKKKMGGS